MVSMGNTESVLELIDLIIHVSGAEEHVKSVDLFSKIRSTAILRGAMPQLKLIGMVLYLCMSLQVNVASSSLHSLFALSINHQLTKQKCQGNT